MMKKKTKTTAKKIPAAKAVKSTASSKGGSKYDQSGAPWWKKFRPTETTASKL